MYVEIKRNNGLSLFIRTAKEVEDLFRSDSTRRSNRYFTPAGDKLIFYGKNENVSKIEKFFDVDLSDYGSPLILDPEDGAYNRSVLRTVDISSGIELRVDELISKEELVDWVNNLKDLVRRMYVEYVKKVYIKASLMIEEI